MSTVLCKCTVWKLTRHLEKKARRKLHKTSTSYTTQILETTPHEGTALWPHSSHLKTIQVRRIWHERHCWRSKDKLKSCVLSWIASYGLASDGRPARIYQHQLSVDTGYRLEDLPGVMDDWDGSRERERESQGNLFLQSDLRMMMMMMITGP